MTQGVFENYLVYLSQTKKSSQNTIESYARDIKKFISYISEFSERGIFEVTQTDILNFIIFLQNSGKSAATVSRMLSSTKSFFGYLFKEKYIDKNPTDNLHGLKYEKQLPKILSEKQIEALLDSPDREDIKGIRDKAILELLYATGIRATNLLTLKESDIDADIGYVRCREKNEERIAPVYAIARESLKNYVDKRKDIKNAENTDIFFLNLNGEPLTRQGLWKIVKSYGLIAGISIPVTPNIIRDCFAVHMLENGADLKFVQEMMGHKDISSTRIYEQAIRDKLIQTYDKVHPRAKHRS